MKAWLGIFVLGLGFFLPSCATVPILPQRTPDPQELLRKVKDRGQQIQGLKGLARVKVSAPGNRYSGPEVLWVRRPFFLRLESLGPLGTPQLYMTTDGREVRVYIPAENRYYHGPAQDRLPAMALPIVLPLEDLVSILLGDVPWPREEGKAAVRRDEEGAQWVLEILFPSRQERQSLWIDPQTFQVMRAEIRRPGLSFQFDFQDFETVRGLRFPRQTRLVVPEKKIQITAVFEETELNPSWEEEDFLLPAPRGAVGIPMERRE